ncbi:DUF2388 domain-containing protein [Pseudomonas guariconensis]|uniref:DUF2388 domain-containing protein n=1 Tax=Pseudomonas guariconensis TaxID=1288410 RepID=UPI002E1C3D91
MNYAHTLMIVLVSGQVWAMDGKGHSSDHFIVGSSLGTAALSESTSHPPTRYALAQEEALAFVASAGQYPGARLSQALRDYRLAHPHSSATDEALAQAMACQGGGSRL